jgi:putative transcriptional regulator
MKNMLKEHRARLGLSQAALADQLGVSRQSINAIETGKWDPSLPLAFELADLFGCKVEELFIHK